MKHTPGPWTLETVPTQIGICHKIGPFPSNGVYETTHACVYSNNVRMSDLGYSTVGDELLANARLIAAAPEMLDILIELCRLEMEVDYGDERERTILDAMELIGRVVGDDKSKPRRK